MRSVLLAMMLTGVQEPVQGQRFAEDSVSAACLARLPMRVDTTTEEVFVVLPRRDRREPRDRFDFRVAQVRVVLAAMDPIPLLAGEDDVPSLVETGLVPRTSIQDVSGLVWFQVRRDGRLAGLTLDQSTGYPVLDSALLRAVVRADSARRLLPLAGSYVDEPVDQWLPVTRMRGTDRVAVARARRIYERYPGAREQPPSLRSWWQRSRWPANWRSAGLGDSLVLEFVIRPDGRADSTSFRVVRGAWREYAETAREVIMAAEFNPGRVGPCRVATRVRMPFNYTIRRR